MSFYRNHPLNFFKYLEWILLGIVAFSELPLMYWMDLPRRPVVVWLGLLAFTGLGINLPRQLSHRLLYTLVEFILVGLITWVGGARSFAPLMVVLVMRNCLLFEGHLRNLFTMLAFGLTGITWWFRFRGLFAVITGMEPMRLSTFWLSLMLLSGLVMVFLQLLVSAILAERQSRERLAQVNVQLRHYALQIEDLAVEQERNRIAREIHDALGHSLTVFNLHLEAALHLLTTDPQEARALLLEAQQVGATTLRDVRQSVAALRADPLAGQSLQAAITHLVEDLCRSSQMTPRLTITNRVLPEPIKIAVYRIIQESLTNICKYAAATEVEIDVNLFEIVAKAEAKSDLSERLQVRIQDNGRGFDPEQNTTGFGLQGMRERTLALGGEFELIAKPGRGCQIQAIFPLP